MKRKLGLLTALGIMLAGHAATAATIEYTFQADLAFRLDGVDHSTSIEINGLGDTEDRLSIDGTRIANAFTGTLSFGSTEVTFTEQVFAARSGGTLAFAADIVGTSIGTVLSGNIVPTSFNLVTDAEFLLTSGAASGSVETDGGLFELFSFRADSNVVFRSELVDDVAAVPLPASMPMLLAGLAVVGAAGLRRAKTV